MKKLLASLLLCAVFVFSAIGFVACGNNSKDSVKESDIDDTQSENVVDDTVFETPTPDDFFTFTLLNDDTYEIKAKDVQKMPEGVVLPSTYDKKAVTKIGEEAFEGCAKLVSIAIPKSITFICKLSFAFCSSLTDVTFGNNSKLTNIDDYAFRDCDALTSINFGANSQLTSNFRHNP